MKTPKKSIKKYCGGDHCTMLWNLPCSEDHGLPKKSKKKMYKVPKCPNTVTGEHKFVDTSYKICNTEVLYKFSIITGRKVPTGSKTHCTKVKRPIRCEYCNLVDDRLAPNHQ